MSDDLNGKTNHMKPSISGEPDIPPWLQEEPSKDSEELSGTIDPWLSRNIIEEELTILSTKHTKLTGHQLSKSSNISSCSVAKNRKRPRPLSESEAAKKKLDPEVPKEDDSSYSSNDDTSSTDIMTPPDQATGVKASSSPTSSDSADDIIIDDCTFSDGDDCVILDNTAAPPRAPDPPTAADAPPAPFGLEKTVPVDEDTVLVTTAARFCLLPWGAYQVRVLRGAVSLHGARLTPARATFLPVFALRVKALPPLLPAAEPPDAAPQAASAEELSALPAEAVEAVRRTAGCALLLRRLPSRLLTLLSARLGDTFAPPLSLTRLGFRLVRSAAEVRRLGLRQHVSGEEWERWLRQVEARAKGREQLRIVFTGGKGVGKSTWMYYVLNLLLNTWRHVYVLDVDPGQAEFTPCACLSLVKVATFLVGPSFTHLTKPVKSVFLGEVSVANDPAGYMDAVQQLVESYRRLADGDPAPLLVNTMGWAKGLGEDLLLEVLGLTHPTDLLEAVHPTKDHINFSSALTPERVNSAGRSWLVRRYMQAGSPGRPAVRYRHARLAATGLAAETAPKTSGQLAPWMYRQLNTTAFVASLEREGQTLCQLTPVCIQWSSLALHVCQRPVRPEHLMHAMNGTVVALGRTEPASWLRNDADPTLYALLPAMQGRPECLGFGLVRGVDPARRLLYLLTSLPPAELASANTLLRGPHHLLDVFSDSGLRSWTPALTEDPPPGPLDRPSRRPAARARPLHPRYGEDCR